MVKPSRPLRNAAGRWRSPRSVDLSGEQPARPSETPPPRLRPSDLCYRDVSTTMIYTHVLNRGPAGVRSPAARMFL
jgi:hypothetical protein